MIYLEVVEVQVDLVFHLHFEHLVLPTLAVQWHRMVDCLLALTANKLGSRSFEKYKI